MFTSDLLDVRQVHTLQLRSHRWMRIDLLGLESTPPRDILTGKLADDRLVGVVRQHGRLGDLVGTFWAAVFLVSERLREVLRAGGVSGWTTRPVVVEGADAVNAVSLHLLCVHGRCGPVIERADSTSSKTGGVGQYLDPGEWDGSDVFVAANHNAILLSDRGADVIRRARLSNVEVSPAGLEPLPIATAE
jgi:hypothetical protein